MKFSEGVDDALALYLRELVPPTVLETAPALVRVKLLDGLVELNLLELSAIEVIRLATQGGKALGTRLAFVDSHARLVQDSRRSIVPIRTHCSHGVSIGD